MLKVVFALKALEKKMKLTPFLATLSLFAISGASYANPVGDVHLLGRQITPEQYVKSLNQSHDPDKISDFFSRRLASNISKEERGAIIDVVDQLRLPLEYNVRNQADLTLYKEYLVRKKSTPVDKPVSFIDTGVRHGTGRAVTSNMLEEDNRKRLLLTNNASNQGFLTAKEEQELKSQINKTFVDAKQTVWEKNKAKEEQARMKKAVAEAYENNRKTLAQNLNAAIRQGELDHSCQLPNVAQVFTQSDDTEYRNFYPEVKIGKFKVTQRKYAQKYAVTVPSLAEIQSKLTSLGEKYNSWLGYNQFVIEVDDSATYQKMLRGNEFVKSTKKVNLQQQSVNDLAIFSIFLDSNDRADFFRASEALVKFNSTVCVY